MTVWKTIKRILRIRTGMKTRPGPAVVLAAGAPVEKTTPAVVDFTPPTPEPEPAYSPGPEIDFGRSADLETYTERLQVPEEEIQRWISAGLLYPEELRNAERMLKILRRKTELSRVA